MFCSRDGGRAWIMPGSAHHDFAGHDGSYHFEELQTCGKITPEEADTLNELLDKFEANRPLPRNDHRIIKARHQGGAAEEHGAGEGRDVASKLFPTGSGTVGNTFAAGPGRTARPRRFNSVDCRDERCRRDAGA